MQHVQSLIPRRYQRAFPKLDATYFRERIPALQNKEISDQEIEAHRGELLEYLRQQGICASCRGYSSCGKEGDMQGFIQELELNGRRITIGVRRCQPFREAQLKNRVDYFVKAAWNANMDDGYTFATFPRETRDKYPRLFHYAKDFADTFTPGERNTQGAYLFGPPGVGKTHLMVAVVQRLRERGVPCLFLRADSMFDHMRHVLAEGRDLEPYLEICSTVPVLAIDEFAQERANEFTMEKLFRVINHRFHANLPTWFTSNYSPPQIYKRDGADVLDAVDPLRSRVLKMAKMARMEGPDARQRNLQSLT